MTGEGIEFTIMERSDGSRVIASPIYDPRTEEAALLVAANLVLEGFSNVEFVQANLVPALRVSIKRLNWKIFPEGRIPWAQVRQEMERVIERAPPSAQPVIRARTSAVERYGPDFVAIGQAGFDGYLVFGFTRHRLYVLESRMLDNATYVLGADWETVSRLTKADIINNQLAVARLVHDRGWPEKLDQTLRHVIPRQAA